MQGRTLSRRLAPAPESIEICVRRSRLGGSAEGVVIGRGSLDMSIVQPCSSRDSGYNGRDQMGTKYILRLRNRVPDHVLLLTC